MNSGRSRSRATRTSRSWLRCNRLQTMTENVLRRRKARQQDQGDHMPSVSRTMSSQSRSARNSSIASHAVGRSRLRRNTAERWTARQRPQGVFAGRRLAFRSQYGTHRPTFPSIEEGAKKTVNCPPDSKPCGISSWNGKTSTDGLRTAPRLPLKAGGGDGGMAGRTFPDGFARLRVAECHLRRLPRNPQSAMDDRGSPENAV